MRRLLNAIFEVPRTGAPLWKRVILVEIGLIVCGLAFAIMLRAAIGLDPWDAFHQGISFLTGVSIGTVVVIVGFAVMFLWIFLKQKLGLGTIMNAITIGISINVFYAWIPTASNFLFGVVYFVVGIFINGVGISMYVGGGLGPGPRDGLMTGLVKRTGKPLWLIRTAIEVVVLGLGWAFGGTIGLGTVLYAFTIGPVVHVMLPWFNLDKVKEPEDLEGH
ncbi:putative membrane protein YczE [Aurantimicrobium minutum]|jgi:uncharacterized membrane protein YczE|uniref:membrane protein YczE n=1 Tax=Aurantimicrobium minutum TaxID=708131 RepID=UPI0024743129|nr:hypothetical protein [Aurantimicrobium minutum]MDH6278582.1 putative membrane protein YczE [Aurantimicrobium minutum]